MAADKRAVMIKKLFLFSVLGVGLVYGLGYDFGSLKRQILGTSQEQARGYTANAHDNWGGTSRY